MAEAPQYASRSTMWPRFNALDPERVIRHNVQNIEFVWIQIVVILCICRCRRHHFTYWPRTCVRHELKIRESLIHTKPLHRISDQTHLARRNSNVFSNSSDLHLSPQRTDVVFSLLPPA